MAVLVSDLRRVVMGVAGKKVADYPQLQSEWHSERNTAFSPYQLAAGSNKKVWWKCSGGHEFFASPNGRTNNGRNKDAIAPCPNCGGIKYWTWEKIVQIAKEMVEKEGHLPPAAKFQAAGHAMLIQCLYKHGKTWGDLQEATNSFDTSSFIQSRNGIRWRSHPEASLSNFLFARGFHHEKGRKYPDDYAKLSGKTYGYYDLFFTDKSGRSIDVEIWGDKPNGHNERNYALVRAGKEKYNQGREGFLGIHYSECFSDKRLTAILEPYIGIVEPHIFEKASDQFLETAHWSNADELLETCRKIAAAQPDGKFPTEDWLRKRGQWANREGRAYNTVSVYIKLWIGGTRKLRELLGQTENSSVLWDEQKAIAAYEGFYKKYGKTPTQMRTERGKNNSKFSAKIINEGCKISSAVLHYAGGTEKVDKTLGIEKDRTRKWPSELILERYRQVIREWGVTPNQLRYDHKNGKVLITPELYKELGQLIDAANRKFGGSKKIMEIIELKAPSRKHTRSRDA